MDGDLHARVVGHGQAGVDGGGRRAPVLVQLEAAGASEHLLPQCLGRHGVALAEQHDVDRHGVHRFVHAGKVPRARRDGRCLGAVRRAGAAADDGGDARRQRLVDDLRADEVHVAVDGAGGEDAAIARQDLGRRTDDETEESTPVMVSGLPALPIPTIRPSRTPTSALTTPQWSRIERARDDEVGRAIGTGTAGLAHRLADHLAAAEHRFVAAGAHDRARPRSRGRCRPGAHGRRWSARTAAGSGRERSQPSRAPATSPRSPATTRSPPIGTSVTVRLMPGSNRTDVPAGMSRRLPSSGDPVERQRRVRLGEVVVRADLHRPVAAVDHVELRAG